MRETYGCEVYYDLPDPKLKQATQWLTANPNRVNLGRIGLRYKGDRLNPSSISESKQVLELWNGTIISTFKVDGKDVKVNTQGDFESDAVVFSIESDLLVSGDLQVRWISRIHLFILHSTNSRYPHYRYTRVHHISDVVS